MNKKTDDIFFCNNCGKQGHSFHQCKMPITSNGVIAFRYHPHLKEIQFLMIRRKDTLGYMDFMRGKFPIHQKQYILNMLLQMTMDERNKLRQSTISYLHLFSFKLPTELSQSYNEVKEETHTDCESFIRNGVNGLSKITSNNNEYVSQKHDTKECNIKEKIQLLMVGNLHLSSFKTPSPREQLSEESCTDYASLMRKGVNGVAEDTIDYNLLSLLDEADQISVWNEPEWGFPKGRRNTQEKDYECALREFSEETGYHISILNNIRNIVPFEEIFIGSNYKAYRHKYYLMNVSYKNSLTIKTFQKSEVSGMEWKNYEDCLRTIRSYNLEKKKMLMNVYNCLIHTLLYQVKENIGDTSDII